MSEAGSKAAKNGERSCKYANSISRTTSETLRVTDVEVGVATQIPASQRQKKSSFQITSVVTATRMSNDGGEDSADDLDESHTEDISDVVDNSRVTDLENETPSYSEDTFSKDDVFFNPSSTSFGTAPVIPTSSQYGLAIVSTNDPNSINQSNANEINISDSSNVINITNVKNAENELGRESTHVTRNERFKVVKIESTEPFKRGRWQCMDYLDHTMLHHHPQQTVINMKNEVPEAAQNQTPLVQNSFQGQEGGFAMGDAHEEVENYNQSHSTPQNMQNNMQNSVSPGQSVHNLQISISKTNPANPIPNQNINQQQIIQAQAQAQAQAQSMSHTTVPMQQNVQQTQSLPHQQMQQVISQANFSQQNSTQPQNIQNQSQPHPPIQNMPSQISQTQPIPQPQQISQPQQHPQMNQPQGNIQQQQQQQQQHSQMQQLQQIQQQMMQSNSMSQAQMNHNIQQYYPAGNQTSILTNQNQMMPNQQVVQGGPTMLNQQSHMQQANMSHNLTQAAQQMHQGQNMMNMGQQMGHPIQQYPNQAIPVQMQQQLQQNYNQQLVQNQIQQVSTQNAPMGGYVMPTNPMQNQQISQGGAIIQNQPIQQQNPNQAIQQTTSIGNQMPQLMQQGGQMMQGGPIIPQPQQTVLSGGPSSTAIQGQQMLQPQNYQNFTQTQQSVGINVGGTPSSNQPISYSNAGPAGATGTQNQAITYSTAPVSVNPVNQAIGYNSQASTSQAPVIPFTNTNINQQMTYTNPSVNVNQSVTQPGQSSAVGGANQQGIQNAQLGQSTMQNQNVISQIQNQINQTIPTSQTVMQSSGVLGQTPMQQSQIGQSQVMPNQTSSMLVSNQSVLTQPQQSQIGQNVSQMGKIVSAAEMTQNPSNLNLPMTVLEGSGLDCVRGNQPFAMDLPGSVALLESLVEVTASGEQFVPNDDESVGVASRAAQGSSVSGGETESVPASVVQPGSARSRAPSPNPCSASGTTTGAIDNKIEQAMDLVKTHLMLTVREEVEVLKDKIAELMDRINQLELENSILKAHASQETLSQLSSQVSQKAQQPPNSSSS